MHSKEVWDDSLGSKLFDLLNKLYTLQSKFLEKIIFVKQEEAPTTTVDHATPFLQTWNFENF